jgi:hypothetical protein
MDRVRGGSRQGRRSPPNRCLNDPNAMRLSGSGERAWRGPVRARYARHHAHQERNGYRVAQATGRSRLAGFCESRILVQKFDVASLAAAPASGRSQGPAVHTRRARRSPTALAEAHGCHSGIVGLASHACLHNVRRDSSAAVHPLAAVPASLRGDADGRHSY